MLCTFTYMCLCSRSWEVVAHQGQTYAEFARAFVEAQGWTDTEVFGLHGGRVVAEQHQAFLIVLLKHKDTNKWLCNVNTHLYYHPAWPHVKALQTWLLLHAVHRFLQARATQLQGTRPEDVPIVISGDFNSHRIKLRPDAFDPQLPKGGLVSGVYELMTTGTHAAST